MKTVFTLFLSLLFLNTTFSQSNLGFKYQAVAMDKNGKILKEHELNVKIKLMSDVNSKANFYEEEHTLVSNKNGIINTVIGQGTIISGDFSTIPWQSKSIWIHIALDTDMDRNYEMQNYTQLLAVPYALYALEAERIADIDKGADMGYLGGHGNGQGKGNDVFPFWTVDGNELAKQHNEGRLGTINERDIIIITSNLERGRIYANGDAGFFYNVQIDQDLDVYGLARFNNVKNSTSKDDGSLVVEGGIGVEMDVNIGGNITQDDIDDVATLGHVIVTDTSNSTAPTNGSLKVDGGAGFAKDVNVGGDLTVKGDLVGSGLIIKDVERTGSDDEWGSYPVQVDAKDQGIAIKLDDPTAENNFVTFFNGDYEPVGRIEGQTKIDILESTNWIVETTFQSAAIASSLGAFASQAASDVNLTLDVGGVIVDLANHSLAITGAIFGSAESGAGVGDLVCVSAIAILDLAYSTIQLGGGFASSFVDLTVTAFDATTNIANFIQYQTLTFLNSGSTFSSGSADYAEYLPKMNASETFMPGDVVAVVNGKITKDLSLSSQLMVISSDPLVLGNMPMDGDEQLYEKVAFMGQVPVKVNGAVQSGDYLIADENNDGFAKAVSPEALTLEDCKKIVGISWGSSELKGINYVNTAIGLNKNDVIPVLENQVKEMDKLKVEINEIKKYIAENEAILADLIPGYEEAKKGKSLSYEDDLIATVNNSISKAAQENVYNQLEAQNLFALLDGYTHSGGDSYLPMDNSQTMAMLNKIDNEHNLDLSLFAENSAANPLSTIESMAQDILSTDYVLEFKNLMSGAIADAVQVVADQILDVKDKMIQDIASNADFTATEKQMLEEKIDKILPVFGLMENSGQIVSDITEDVFAIIDAATCSICDELNALPIGPNEISDAINVPINFFIETVDFFVGTLDQLNSVCISEEICISSKCAGFSVCPFDFIPVLDFDVNDMPFVENKELQIQFPNLCASVTCN